MARLGVRGAVVDGTYVGGDVDVRDGVVAAVGLPRGPSSSGVAIPGMLDLQVNGFDGVDFLSADDEGWRKAARALAHHGVTAHLAALITSEPSALTRALTVATRVMRDRTALESHLLGTHLEGPFLSPLRAGTHPVESLLRPSVDAMRAWLDAGPVRLVTLAPELPGALDVITWLHRRGVTVSLGHSAASAEESHAGFAAGATSVTHLFNAMTTPTAREPGLAGAAMVHDGIAICLICDGTHVAEDVVRLVHRAAGERVVLVSDVIEAGGRGDGSYRLGGVDVEVTSGAVRRGDGTLAGSALPLADAFRLYAQAGVSFEQAVAAVTSRPATVIGAPIPLLRPGDVADVVVMDDSLRVRTVLLGGRDVT